MNLDVIISGGGATGLSFACSLADTNLNVRVYEKLSEEKLAEPPTDGRDIALTHLSVKILKELGAWHRIPDDAISPIKEARVLDGTSPYFLHFDHRKIEHKALSFLVPNHLIRKALYEQVKAVTNVQLVTGVTVTSLSTDSEKGSVVLSSGETVEAPLVISSDSRFSETRRNMGISTTMQDFGQMVIVCRMQHEESHDNIAYECFHYGRTLAVLPLTGNESSIVITVHHDRADEVLNMAEDKFSDDISERFEHRLGKMKLISKRYSYPLVAVLADRFVANRYALLGDAAVGMHPVTAHGFNLGLRGQDTLAREIKSAITLGVDIGDSKGLVNYQAKHRRISKPLYLVTNSIVRLYTNDKFLARIMRKSILILGNNIWSIKHAIMNQLTEIES